MKRRVYFLGNPDKPAVGGAMEDLISFAGSRCEVVGSSLGLDVAPAIQAGVDRIVVVGGDGTLIGVARALGENQIPLIGVNAGKLGFMAEFTIDEVKEHFDRALGDDEMISRRGMLQVRVEAGDETSHRSKRKGGNSVSQQLAVNDCVIHAGPPFRMIRLGVSIDGEHLTEVSGDGLIVCTPSGSTAHNLSAGGPIVQPDLDALILTPLNPHSITHKPLVIEREAVIEITATQVNEGTTAIVDGQVSYPLATGHRVIVRRSDTNVLLVRNGGHSQWHNLVTKLHWGRAPQRD